MNVRTNNAFRIVGNIAECKTTNGHIFYIDKDDIEKALQYTWCLSKTGYLVANIKHKVTKLHRYLLDCKDNEFVDHIDGNPRNNSRLNLRLCNQTQNTKNVKLKKNNSSGYPGISYLTNIGKFRVRIMVNRKEIALGRYNTFEEALKVRVNAEKKYFKQFAPCYGALKKALE